MWNYTLIISLASVLVLWLLIAASRTHRRSVWVNSAILSVSGVVSSTIITFVGLQWFRGHLELDGPIVEALGYGIITVPYFETFVLVILFTISLDDG